MNSYAPQIWTQPYFHHNIIKYEVTLQIVLQKHIFLFSTGVEENKSHIKGIINSILHTNKYHKMKERNFRKIQEKEISNLEF